MPSAISLAAAHKGKLKNIRNAVLKDNAPSVTAILNFEKEASKVDIQLRSAAGSNEGMCTHKCSHIQMSVTNNLV